jgi:hypothetical protein
MPAARARIAAFLVVSGIGAAIACGDSAKPLGSGDKFYNDTAGEDVYSPPLPPPPSDGGEGGDAYVYDSGDGNTYAPALDTCSACSCDPSKNYCMSGGVLKADRPFPGGSGGGFGEPDGAAEAGPPPPPCKILDAGSLGNGCIPLPSACKANPTCTCLLDALQPYYKCYLVCTPTPGYLEVYCPGP